MASGDPEGRKLNRGDPVVFAGCSGTEIGLEGEDHRILDAGDLLGIV